MENKVARVLMETYPNTLTLLAKSKKRVIRIAVAKNPNTLAEDLLRRKKYEI